MIVADLPYADSSVEKVDVTEMLLDWLKQTSGYAR